MSELTSLPRGKPSSSRSSISSSGSNDSNDFNFGFNLGSKFNKRSTTTTNNTRKSNMILGNDFGDVFSSSNKDSATSEDESESNDHLTSVGGGLFGKKKNSSSSEKLSRKNSNKSSSSSSSSTSLTKLNMDLFGKKNSNTNTENTDENVSTSGFSDIDDDEVGEMLGLDDFNSIVVPPNKKETKKKDKKNSPKKEDAYSFDSSRSKRPNSSKRPSGFASSLPTDQSKKETKKKSKQKSSFIEDDFDDDKLMEEQEREILKIKEREEQERKAREDQEKRDNEERKIKEREEQEKRENEETERKIRKELEEKQRKEREEQERKEREERERQDKLEQERKQREEQERKEREERLRKQQEEQVRKELEEKQRKEREEHERKEREERERKERELKKQREERAERERQEQLEREKRESENKKQQNNDDFGEEVIDDEDDFGESDFDDSFRGSIEQPRAAEDTDLENFTDFEDGHMEETVEEEEEVFDDDDFDFSSDPIEEHGRKSLSYIDPEEPKKSRQSSNPYQQQQRPSIEASNKTGSPIKLSDLSSSPTKKLTTPKKKDLPPPAAVVPASFVQRSLVKEDLENISGLLKIELKQEFLDERSKLVARIDELQKTIQQQEIQIKENMKKQLEYELKEKNLVNELKQEHEEMIHRMKLNFEQEKQATVNNVRIEFETTIQKSHLKIEQLKEEVRQKELKIQEDSEGFSSRLQREKERADLTISTEMENLKRRNQMEIDQIHKLHDMEKMSVQQRQKDEIEEHKRIFKEEYDKKMKNIQVESSLNELIKKVEVNAHSVETLHNRLYDDQMKVFKQKDDHLVVRERLIAETEKLHLKQKEELATERSRIQMLYVEMETNMKSIQKNYEEERLQTLKKERELEEKKRNYEKDFELKMKEIFEMREKVDDDKSRFIVERQQFIVDTQEERSKLSRFQKEAMAEKESARIEHTSRMKELFERESQVNAEKKGLDDERRLIKEMKDLIERERRDIEELKSVLIKEKETFYQQHEHLAQKLIQVQADSEQVTLKYQEIMKEKAENEKMRDEAESLNRNYLAEKKNLKTLERQLMDQRKMLELERLEITKSRKQIGSEKAEISTISERIRKAEMTLNEQLKFMDMTSVSPHGGKDQDLDEQDVTPPRRRSMAGAAIRKENIQDDFSVYDDMDNNSSSSVEQPRFYTPNVEKTREDNRPLPNTYYSTTTSSGGGGGWVSSYWDATDSMKSDWKLKEQQKFLDHITLQKRVFCGDQSSRGIVANTTEAPSSVDINPPFISNSPSIPYLHQTSSLNSHFTSLHQMDDNTSLSKQTISPTSSTTQSPNM